MSITLSELVSRVQGAIPAQSGVPSLAQYQQAVQDAVNDFGQRCPVERVTTLAITAGTASYPLPADFLHVIQLAPLQFTAGVLLTAGGLVPCGRRWQERYTVAGLTLTLTPTPTYTLTRQLWYAAGYPLDAQGVYADLSALDASILLWRAQANALRYQALALASTGEVVEYQIGDERIKREGGRAAQEAMAQALEAWYIRDLSGRLRAIGRRG